MVPSIDVLIPASNVAAAVIALVSENIFADVIPPVDEVIGYQMGKFSMRKLRQGQFDGIDNAMVTHLATYLSILLEYR